jgi:hypothetical protein
MNNHTTIVGKAFNGKEGALIKTPQGDVYYLEELTSWDSTFLHQTVEATGILSETTLSENDLQNEQGEYNTGIAGKKYTLSNPTFSLVK